MDTSPVKRRVLGALDPNASSPRPQHISGTKMSSQPSKPVHRLIASPRSSVALSPVAGSPEKRTIDNLQTCPAPEGGHQAKRVRLTVEDKAHPKPRSPSPADDSIFDHSAADTSQATAITEPDAEHHTARTIPPLPSLAGSVPRRPAPRLTREEAREKAEILRLRLGLANYKVRTGQTDVPLERLQQRPIPGQAPIHTTERNFAPPVPLLGVREVAQARADIIGRFREVAQMNAPAQQPVQAPPQARQSLPRSPVRRPVGDDDDDDDEPDVMLPRLPPPPPPQERASADGARPTTPQRTRPARADEELSSSALRGGAASGLLCLSRS